MMKLSCRDAGFNCDFVMQGASEDEVIQKAREHGAKQHGIQQLSPDMERKLRGRIRNA
jgi:predicted small metal-binding protein